MEEIDRKLAMQLGLENRSKDMSAKEGENDEEK